MNILYTTMVKSTICMAQVEINARIGWPLKMKSPMEMGDLNP